MTKPRLSLRPNRPARMGALPAVAAIGAVFAVAGCAAFGGNVKGNFACQAPSGICAPTRKIDDQALATMGAQSADPGGLQPAGLVARATQHSPTTLKIVLTARRDRFGRWREASVVYIEPDLAVATAGGDAVSSAAPRLTLSELAAGAPELAVLRSAQPPASTAEMKTQVDAVLAKGSIGTGAMAEPAAAVAASNVGAAAAERPAIVSAPKFPASGAAGEF